MLHHPTKPNELKPWKEKQLGNIKCSADRKGAVSGQQSKAFIS